jgi:hypothetical protein
MNDNRMDARSCRGIISIRGSFPTDHKKLLRSYVKQFDMALIYFSASAIIVSITERTSMYNLFTKTRGHTDEPEFMRIVEENALTAALKHHGHVEAVERHGNVVSGFNDVIRKYYKQYTRTRRMKSDLLKRPSSAAFTSRLLASFHCIGRLHPRRIADIYPIVRKCVNYHK